MSSSKLGIITIGQSPRIDLTSDMFNILREDIEIVERGVLDSYTFGEVDEIFKPLRDEPKLVSRMRDGSQVILSENMIISKLQEEILNLEKQVDMILLLCTGTFPKFNSEKPLIIPKPLIKAVVDELRYGHKIGIVIPDLSQQDKIQSWWKSEGVESEVCVFSPYLKGYGIDSIKFEDESIEYVILDCMGYSEEMKQGIIRQTGKKVILPRTFLARMINEIMN